MINLTTSPPAGNDSVLASFLEAPSERRARENPGSELPRKMLASLTNPMP
jgi:hypothetical protein